MLREQVNYKLFTLLVLGAIVLGLILAAFIYPKDKNPLFKNTQNENTESIIFTFPEEEVFHPLKKTPSNTQTPDTNKETGNDEKICAQVITPALNRETLEIRQFSTPCDVPEGWEVLK